MVIIIITNTNNNNNDDDINTIQFIQLNHDVERLVLFTTKENGFHCTVQLIGSNDLIL